MGLLSVFVAGGCSLWQPTDVAISELPATRMSEDSVIWEIEVAYVLPDDVDFHALLWIELDEQHLPVDISRRLALNGFRCGLVGMPLPAVVLQQQLDRQKPSGSGGSDSVPVSDLATAFQRRRLQARARQRYEIVAPQVRDELVALYHEEGELRGDRYPQAQCVLAARSLPQGDGRVKLEITPEIHYGPARQHFTVHGGVFQVQAKRDSKIFDQLRFEATLSPGQTLLLTTTRDAKGLGGAFFTESVDGRTQQKLLLIRLAQTQYDDRFAPDQGKHTPLVTSDL